MEEDTFEKAIKQLILNARLLDFLRDTKLPIETVNNSKFIALMEFVKPGIVLPKLEELAKLVSNHAPVEENCEESNTGQNRKSDRTLRKRKLDVVEKKKKKKKRKRIPNSDSLPQTVTPALDSVDMADSDTVPMEEPEESPVLSVTENSEFNNCSNAWVNPPTEEEKPSTLPNSLEHSPKPDPEAQHCMLLKNGSEVIEMIKTAEEIKSETETSFEDSLENDLPSTSSSNNSINQQCPVNYDKVQIPQDPEASEWPALDDDDQQHSGEDRHSTSPNNYENIGYSAFPCIVCGRFVKIVNLRTIYQSHAHIIFIVCFRIGKYTLETAKEYAALKRYLCCADHLDDMHRETLDSLGIVDPKIDVHKDNETILECYKTFKEIRDVPPAPSAHSEKCRYEGFLKTLKSFFSTYGRESYINISRRAQQYTLMYN